MYNHVYTRTLFKTCLYSLFTHNIIKCQHDEGPCVKWKRYQLVPGKFFITVCSDKQLRVHDNYVVHTCYFANRCRPNWNSARSTGSSVLLPQYWVTAQLQSHHTHTLAFPRHALPGATLLINRRSLPLSPTL